MAIVAFLPSANIFNWTVIWTSKSFQNRLFFVVVVCLSPMSLSRSQSSNLRWVHIRPDSVDFHRQAIWIAIEFEIEPFRLCSPDRFHLRSHCCCLQRLSAPLRGFFLFLMQGLLLHCFISSKKDIAWLNLISSSLDFVAVWWCYRLVLESV